MGYVYWHVGYVYTVYYRSDFSLLICFVISVFQIWLTVNYLQSNMHFFGNL